jgi:transcriptional antiterminator NusG
MADVLGLDNWYALFCKTGDEENVKERLKYRLGDSFNVIVPKRRLRERKKGEWSFVTRTLFPGYVLVQGSMDADEYYEFKGVPGLFRLIRTGPDFAKIEAQEMEVLGQLICNDEIIGFSKLLAEGNKIKVVDGPLVSMEGLIESINHRKGRARVRLNFLGELRTVELGVEILRPEL